MTNFEIEGHKVTVRLSDDEADAGIADDLILQVRSSGSSVIVKTYSDSGTVKSNFGVSCLETMVEILMVENGDIWLIQTTNMD